MPMPKVSAEWIKSSRPCLATSQIRPGTNPPEVRFSENHLRSVGLFALFRRSSGQRNFFGRYRWHLWASNTKKPELYSIWCVQKVGAGNDMTMSLGSRCLMHNARDIKKRENGQTPSAATESEVRAWPSLTLSAGTEKRARKTGPGRGEHVLSWPRTPVTPRVVRCQACYPPPQGAS